MKLSAYNKIKNKLSDFVDMWKNLWTCHTHFEWFAENPFYIINNKTIRSLFAAPSVRFQKFPTYVCPYWSDAVFGIYLVGLEYKSKYNAWRYEGNPFIQFNLFGYSFRWELVCPCESVSKYGYWESILDCYCNYAALDKGFNLYNIIERNTWTKWNKDDKEEREDMTKILTPVGITKYWNDKAVAMQSEAE